MRSTKKILAVISALLTVIATLPLSAVPVSAAKAYLELESGGSLKSGNYLAMNDISSTITIEKDAEVILDLDGWTLSTSGTSAIVNNGSLTIEGEGKLSSTNAPVIINNGDLKIHSGSFTSNGSDAVISLADEAGVSISDGTLQGEKLFECGSNSFVSINGGTYLGNLNIEKNKGEVTGGTFSSERYHL